MALGKVKPIHGTANVWNYLAHGCFNRVCMELPNTWLFQQSMHGTT